MPRARRKIFTFLAATALVVFVAPLLAHAQIGSQNDATIADSLGIGTNTDIRLAIIQVVQYILGFLGLLAVIIVLYFGYVWMTAAGDTDRIEQAKKNRTEERR